MPYYSVPELQVMLFLISRIQILFYNEPRKQDRQNRENKLEWDHGKETKFYT